MASEGCGARLVSRVWLLPALGAACAACAAGASGEQGPLPRAPAAVEGARRTVRYELARTVESDGGGDGNVVLSSRGCTWIVFEERVARVVGDREMEIEIDVVDGDDPRCDEGRRFTLKAPFADPAPDPKHEWLRGLGPVELARLVHGRLGQPNGAFSFSTRELPWPAAGAIRSGDADYAITTLHEVRPDKDRTGETTSVARLQLRRRDGKLACARAAELWREADAGANAVLAREAIMVDYGDGAPPRCEDSLPAASGTASDGGRATEAPSILSRVQELEATAKRAAGGSMGCGEGTLTLVTSRGHVRIQTGLDPIHVFGPRVATADLLTLLRARIASNQSGSPGPMSGAVGRLGAISLHLFAAAKEPEVLEVSAALLTDRDEKISGTAVANLYELGDRRPQLRPEIRRLQFPKQAAASAGRQPPDWLR